MSLLSYVDQADAKHDRSHWHTPSIEPHEQNRRYRSISCLIELCRDLWLGLFAEKPDEAKDLLVVWGHFRYPVFRRLIMNAYTNDGVTSPDEAISYLLEDQGWWLWSAGTTREVYRLLSKFWPYISDHSASRLLRTVVEGPPRDLYKSDLTQEEFQFRLDRDRWMMLSKLESFGRPVFDDAADLLAAIKTQYPDWVLRGGDRDEFTSWHTTRIGSESDIISMDLLSLPVDQRCDLLAEDNTRYGDGRVDVFRSLAKENPDDVIATLQYLSDNNLWLNKIWHAGLVGMADTDKCAWTELSPLVHNLPKALYQNEGWAISWWARKAIKGHKAESVDEETLWQIAHKLFEANSDVISEMEEGADSVNQAINDPVGIMTEALMDRLSLRAIEAQEGIPRPEPFGLIDKLITENNLSLGKVIIFSRLMYFYSIEPDWVRERLMPLLDLARSDNAIHFWQAYLWNPRISADLAIDIKSHLVNATESRRFSGHDLSNLVSLIIFSALQYEDLFKPKELQNTFRSMGHEGLSFVADFLWRSLSEEESGKESYWENRVMPLIRRNWPKGDEFLSPEIAENLSLVALQLDDSFAQAVNLISPMLCPISDRYTVLNAFKESKSPDVAPLASFKLLSLVFNPENDYNNDLLADLVSRLETAEPSLLGDAEFMMIKDYLRVQNL